MRRKKNDAKIKIRQIRISLDLPIHFNAISFLTDICENLNEGKIIQT